MKDTIQILASIWALFLLVVAMGFFLTQEKEKAKISSPANNGPDIEFCLSVSESLNAYVIYDLESQSCGFILASDSLNLITDVITRDNEARLIWIVGGVITDSNQFKTELEQIEKGIE